MRQWLFVIALILVAGGTIFIVVSRTPEERTVLSDDRRAMLVGAFESSQAVSLSALSPSSVPYTAVIGPVYQLLPDHLTFNRDLQLSMKYGDQTVGSTDAYRLQIGWYDDTIKMWRPIDSDLDPSREWVTANIRTLGRYALLLPAQIARPNLETETQKLIDAPPTGAVGYETFVGYATQPGDYVLLDGLGKSGGCAGKFVTAPSTTMTSASQHFGDHLDYEVVALWQIGGGCTGLTTIE